MADEELTSRDYYHGLLPFQDAKQMLVENGDWLLRRAEPSAPGERLIVLSVQTDKEATGGVKHFRVTKKEDKFQLMDSGTFESIDNLIEYYKKTDIQWKGGAITITLARSITRQKWELEHDDIVLWCKLGETKEAEACEIHKGLCEMREKDGRSKILKAAIKQVKLNALTKEEIREIMHEARVMRYLNHPNIIKLFGVAAGQEPLMLVMELATDGPLDSYLGRNELLPQGKRMEMISQAAWGVEYLHSMNCIHRDIAARSCLYGGGQVKISYFGDTRVGETYQMNPLNKVPIRWLAPETMKTAAYSHKTDVWSWGVLVWEIFNNGEQPYPGLIATEVHKFVKDGNNLDIGAKMDHKAVAKMIEKRAFAYVADDRWSMAAIVKALEKMVGIKQEQMTDEEEEGDKTMCTTETSESGSSLVGSHQASREKSKPETEPRSDRLDATAHYFFEAGSRKEEYRRLLLAHLQESLPLGIIADQPVYVGPNGDIEGSVILCQVDTEHVRHVRARFWAAIAIHEWEAFGCTNMMVQCRDAQAADELEETGVCDGLKRRVDLNWPKLNAWLYAQSSDTVVVYNCPPLLLRCGHLMEAFFGSFPASIRRRSRVDGALVLKCSSVREAQLCKDLLTHFDVLGCRLTTYDR